MKNKSVFITIVVLLCIFAPLTIIGFLNKRNISPLEENPNHDTYYKGYMWFYDEEDNFLSKYECATETCVFANSVIDDDTYGINYYKEGKQQEIKIDGNKYALITDGALVNLYSIISGSILQSYESIKNYNINLENNTYIIQNSEGVWGALIIGDSLKSILPFEYSFIGLKNELKDDNTLSTSKFIVSKDQKWFIVDNNNSALTGYIDDPIVDYTNEYIFSKNNDKVRIYSYDNYEYLPDYNIKNYILEDKYIGIITDSFLLIYENLGNKYIKSIALTDNNGDIDLEKNNNILDIKINGEIKESIELS